VIRDALRGAIILLPDDRSAESATQFGGKTMKAGAMLALAMVTGTLATATAAHAQGADPVRLVSMETEGKPVRYLDDAAVNARLESAERALSSGNEFRARKLYESLQKDLEAEGRLATVAVWRLAAIRFAAGEGLEAAAMLDGLAASAASHGDVGVQVAALFESSHVFEALGNRTAANARMDMGVRTLVASELPMDTRMALLKKVGG
jgi:hypothetical protein